ncbi:MAG TPA: GNAT family N-acetyltransferase [Acetobacteraceae bacterium]|nr:GNAT family N-acetyltransferase [Acetobacteraceae bacterium]
MDGEYCTDTGLGRIADALTVEAGRANARFDPLYPTVFHENWWLAAASGDAWQEVTVHAGAKLVGRLPYVLSPVAAGHRLLAQPELTHVLGPAIDPGAGSPVNQVLKRDAILRELVESLPAASGFHCTFHRDVADTLVFQERGYRTSVQFTHVVAAGAPGELWSAMRDKTRNAIRRAELQFCVAELDDPVAFAAFYDENLRERSATNYYRRIIPIGAAALERGRGRFLVALDGSGRSAAAIFIVWDSQTAYYLLSTRRQDAGNGAISLLIWHAMRDSAARRLVFDFDGVALPGSRVFYTGFGGRAVPRFIVSRYTLGHRVVGRLSHPFRAPAKHCYQW